MKRTIFTFLYGVTIGAMLRQIVAEGPSAMAVAIIVLTSVAMLIKMAVNR